MKLTKTKKAVLSHICSYATFSFPTTMVEGRGAKDVAQVRRTVRSLERLGLVSTHERGETIYVVATKEGLEVCKTLTQDSAASSPSC